MDRPRFFVVLEGAEDSILFELAPDKFLAKFLLDPSELWDAEFCLRKNWEPVMATHQEIRECASRIWEDEGRVDGLHEDDRNAEEHDI
jgi:hypothetical protein